MRRLSLRMKGVLPPAFGGASPVKVCLGKDEGDAPLFTGTSIQQLCFSGSFFCFGGSVVSS